MEDRYGALFDNDEVDELARSKNILENDKRPLSGKVYHKNILSSHNISDSSSDDSPHRHISHGSTKSFFLRKRSHQETFDRNKHNYRDSGYRNYRSSRFNESGGERSPREYDNYTLRKRLRYNNNMNNNNFFTFDATRQSYSSVVSRMNSFKEFVVALDDYIQPEDAVSAYYEYVRMFSNKQLDPFFKNYKQCDWMILKYHPLWKECEHNFVRKCYQIRAYVFFQLYHNGYMDNLILDSTSDNINQKLYHFLIFLNILLECGTIAEIDECKQTMYKDSTLQNSDNSYDSSKLIVQSNTTTNKNIGDHHSRQHDDLDFDENLMHSDINTTTIEQNIMSPTSDTNNIDQNKETNIIEDEINNVSDGNNRSHFKPTENMGKYIEGRHNVIGFNIKAIPVDATRDEIYNTFKDIDGFLRAFVTEPNLGKKDFRRAYLTFKSDINIRDITEKINLIKFRENISLFVRPNHEMTHRVKFQELKSGHNFTKNMLIYDVEFVCELINRLDTKYDIYSDIEPLNKDFISKINPLNDYTGNNNSTSIDSISENIISAYGKILQEEIHEFYNQCDNLPNENPILKPLIELNQQLKTNSSSITEEYIKSIVDPAILYLRIVYSIDYYAFTDYPYEHLRNIRCSTITIRQCRNLNENTILSNMGESILKLSDDELLNIYKNDLASKFSQYLDKQDEDDNIDSFVELKDVQKEVEAFIQENTQKITDEKFLCPLSMKKFKSPEYVRKHILTKHPEKIEQVQLDVIYFNNFVKSRYKNLPFSKNLFKKRYSTSSEIPTTSRPFVSSNDSKSLTIDSVNNELNQSMTSKDSSLQHNPSNHQQHPSHFKNSRSYGRYRDVDSVNSIFDL